MISLKKVSDNSDRQSLSHAMRYKRFAYFLQLIGKLKKPIRILDIGGTQQYWDNMGLGTHDIHITLLNLNIQETTSPHFVSVVGDATNLSEYADKSFDIVFSNSVIEHLFTIKNQKKMASEVMRVGHYYFIQTPNYYFPLEPHFLFPGFQFLPKSIRTTLIHNFNLGHVKRKETIQEARLQIEEIRLLTATEMQLLFPNSFVWKERIGGLVKSMVAHNLV